jgi:DNA-binding winged helix-turn-helix (wHTH) protein/TolB-like protein/tetratricopeptide (TPR) repeat protein
VTRANRNPRSEIIAFGLFEVRPASGELRKQGLKVKLRAREFQVLLAMLEKPGEVVTREELRERLWTEGTFVEFDNGLNNAMHRARSALGDTSGSPRFIETLPRVGYRFGAPVIRRAAEPTKSFSFQRRLVYAVVLVAALLSAGFLVYSMANRTGRIGSLAVLPFASKNASGSAGQAFLAKAVTEAVLLDLSDVRSVRVMPLSTVRRYAHAGESLGEIARRLGADAVASGSVEPEGDTVRVSVRLVRAAGGSPEWTGVFQESESDSPGLTREVTRSIVQAARLHLTSKERETLSAPPQIDPQAYQDYLIGQYDMGQLTESARKKALGYFEQTVAAAPDSALGYAGLANYYEYTDAVPPQIAMPKAKLYALKALHIDEALAPAHVTLGVAYFYGDWNWAASEREFRRALALNPGLGAAHRMYAALLSCEGRVQDAIGQIRQAQQLDPLSVPGDDMATVVWLDAQQYGQSIQEADRSLVLAPKSVTGIEDVGTADMFEGKFSDAVTEVEEVAAEEGNDPYVSTLLGSAYGRWGKVALAQQELREMKGIAEQRYVPPFWFVMVYASLGDKAQALDWLNQAYRERDSYLVFVKVTPWFDSLHSQPGFEQILRKMNFPA